MSDVKPHLIQREKWLTALESGKHRQCIGLLRNHIEISPGVYERAFCALGLAYNETGPDIGMKWELEKAYGFTAAAVTLIVGMNDKEGLSFREIAATVRAHPGKFFKDV